VCFHNKELQNKPANLYSVTQHTDFTNITDTMVHAYTYFVYDRNKGMAVPTPIFTTFKNTQEHYIHISYTEFCSNRALNIETTKRNSFDKTL